MIERWVVRVLLVAPFAYVAAIVLPTFPATEAVVVAVAFGLGVGVAALLEGQGYRYGNAALGTLLGLAVAITVAMAFPWPLGDDLATGALLAIPVIAASVAWRPGEPLALRLFAFGLAIAWGIALLATRQALLGSSTAVDGPAWVGAFLEVNGQQARGIANLVVGAAYPVPPMHTLVDPIFTVLVAGAVLGWVLAFARPQTGLGVPLPLAPPLGAAAASDREAPEVFALSAAQRAVFRARSTGVPPLTTWPPGLLSLLAGAAAVGGFLAASQLLPYRALFALGLGVAVASGVLLALDAATGGRPTHPQPPTAPRDHPR